MKNRSKFQVFITAFILLFCETLFVKTAIFIHDYLTMIFIISYALLGIGIGAVLAACFERLNLSLLKLFLVFSIILTFFNFVFFPINLFLSPIILPFIIGTLIISYYLREENSHELYFFDLIGATIGVFSILFFIPLFHEENCYFFIIALLAFVALFDDIHRKMYRIFFISIGTLALMILVFNIFNDSINFAKIVQCGKGIDKKKIFCWKIIGDRHNSTYGSNTQRIDVLNSSPKTKYIAYDGLVNDHITNHNYQGYKYDRRIIYGLIDKPDILIIGTAAEGILRPAKAIGGEITGLEINNAVIDLMTNKFYDFTRKIYSKIDKFYAMDARTFFYSKDAKQYDIITLINTHKARTVGHFGPPEYLHTKESINIYLDHLNDNGMIVLEERNVNDQAGFGIMKIVGTFIDVLKQRGISDPEKHIFVYDWYGENNRKRGNLYTSVVIKKNPFTDLDWEKINGWAEQLGRKSKRKNIIPIYPENQVNPEFTTTENAKGFKLQMQTYIASKITTEKQAGGLFKDKEMSTITDDRPYPWSVDASYGSVKKILVRLTLVCMGVLICMLGFWKYVHKKILQPYFFSLVLYFSLIGIGYFIIEIGLINFYQMLTGSPSNAVVFILGTLLLSSGLGSYVSKKFSYKKVIVAVLGIVLFSLYHLFINKSFVTMFGFGPMLNSLLIAITIIPLGFCMGIPFPVGLELVKRKNSNKSVPLFFGINGIFSAIATILSLYISVVFGFQITFAIGIMCYVILLVLVGVRSLHVASK